ncbi:uncharacterized protein LOC142331275 [Lycorma delicatula]|uniref:uncharacterized protein LOC142331275 n=1 Tax=Lycorma delicatula TaxID=130591 RepID=UPI003F5118F3
MEINTTELVFLLFWIFTHAECFSTEEIGSPLRVAQCRASCIHTFSQKTSTQKTCLQGPDCYMCWQNCQLLQSNFPVWGALCSQKAVCFPGCEAACKFMDSKRGSQRTPVLVRRGEEVLKIKGQETKWPSPTSDSEGPWVYLVMRRLDNTWRQITQTLENSAKIPIGGTIRVLVVGREGLFTIYSPSPESPTPRDTARNVLYSLGRNTLLLDNQIENGYGQGKRINTAKSVTNAKIGKWDLRLISLIHQQVIVIAEVAWDSQKINPQQRSVYLVTWEVDGGGLQGNLFTDSTCVTLSLWPDTIFHIQVEMVSQDPGSVSKSEKLKVDTRRRSSLEHPQVTAPSVRRHHDSKISGASAGALAFVGLFILLIVTKNCIRVHYLPHVKLVDDLPYGPNLCRVSPPIVTVVRDMKRPIEDNRLRSSSSSLTTFNRNNVT